MRISHVCVRTCECTSVHSPIHTHENLHVHTILYVYRDVYACLSRFIGWVCVHVHIERMCVGDRVFLTYHKNHHCVYTHKHTHKHTYPPALPLPLPRRTHQVLDLCLSGANVFFTGMGGTGKSLVMKKIVEKLRAKFEHADRVVIVAPTGVSAINVGGQTLHSFSGCGVPKSVNEFERCVFGLLCVGVCFRVLVAECLIVRWGGRGGVEFGVMKTCFVENVFDSIFGVCNTHAYTHTHAHTHT